MERCIDVIVYSGYAAVDVANMKKSDNMESYFLSETLKYLYMLYAYNDNSGSVKNGDKLDVLRQKSFVFSTEAHPFWLS